MITGSIHQTGVCDFLAQVPVIQRSLNCIRAQPVEMPEAITQWDGNDLYVNVHGYATKHRASCCWESHRHTADLQYCLTGGEEIDWTPLKPAAASEGYEAARDFEVWPSTIAFAETIHMEAGRFVIFLPGELHRPMIHDGANERVRKLVVKIHERFLVL